MAITAYNNDYIYEGGIAVSGSGQIGTELYVGSSLTVQNGNIYVDNGQIDAKNGFFQTSDERKNTIIKELPTEDCYKLLNNCLEILFSWKNDPENKEQIGMIAQQVEKVFPQLVSTDKNGNKSLDYARLNVVALRLLTDMNRRITEIETQMKEQ